MSDSSFSRKILKIALSAFFVLFVMVSNSVSSMPIAPICMGLLTDVVVADPSEAKKVCENINSKEFVWKEEPDLSVSMLVALQCVLAKKPITKELYKEYPLIFQKGTEGPWVNKISDELVLLLSKIDEKSIPGIVKLWMKEKEADPIQEAPVNLVEKCLKDLRWLSIEASGRKKKLLLRVNL